MSLTLPNAHANQERTHAHTDTSTLTHIRPFHAHLDSDGPDVESSPVGGSDTPPNTRHAHKATPATPPRPAHASTPMERDDLEQRVGGWVTALKAALELDAHAPHQDALVAYNR